MSAALAPYGTSTKSAMPTTAEGDVVPGVALLASIVG
jgi:hypothetical protein